MVQYSIWIENEDKESIACAKGILEIWCIYIERVLHSNWLVVTSMIANDTKSQPGNMYKYMEITKKKRKACHDYYGWWQGYHAEVLSSNCKGKSGT